MQALLATGLKTFIVDEHDGLEGIIKLDGANAYNNVDFQEFTMVPCGAVTLSEALRLGVRKLSRKSRIDPTQLMVQRGAARIGPAKHSS
jgi:hypothetical protein